MYTLTYEGFTLYDPRLTDRDIYNVSTHLAVDEAGSMSFDMPPTHPHLSELAKLKGRLELCSDNTVLWRGRITEDSVDFDGVITIEAEGQLACLNDSIVEPYNFPEDYEDTDEYKSATNVVEFWLKKLLESHNSQVSEEQQIKLGTVTVSDPNNYFSRSCEDYSTTWDVVCDKLRDSSLGGHFLVRYESDGTYLDYVADYPLTNTQSVEFAQNLLELTDELDATEVYTAILPVGKDGLTIASLPDGEVTTGLIKEGKVIYSTKGVENYGRITSVQTWDDVTEASNLRTKAATLLGSTGVMLSRSISVTAVDLHCTDETIASLRVGRYTPIVSEPHGLDVRYVLSELDLDIQDPGSTRLTFGATSKSMSDRANNLRANMRNVSDTANAATSTATAAQSAANTASSTANTALTTANSSVATVTTQYYDSTSATEMTGGSWSDTSPTWQEGHYIWSRTKTVSADGKTTEYSEAVCITGNTGKQGAKGDKGDSGESGRNLIYNSGGISLQASSQIGYSATTEFSNYYDNNLQILRGKTLTFSLEMELVDALGDGTNFMRAGWEIEVTYSDGTKKYLGLWKFFNATTATSVEKGRYSSTFTIQDKEISAVKENRLYIQHLASGSVSLGKPKLEFGSAATDWTPAPEDVVTAQSAADQANTDVQALSTTVVQDYVTSAQLDDRITSEVGALTTTIEGNKETIENRVSDVEQKSGEWSATVSKHTEFITKLQDDVLDVSTTVSKTMKLTEEGLSISAGGSTNTVLITNDSINFKVGEYTAAYISDKQLWIKDAVIENSMTLGKFAFIPRDSGNLSLVRKDG